jgi:hypothetical protein
VSRLALIALALIASCGGQIATESTDPCDEGIPVSITRTPWGEPAPAGQAAKPGWAETWLQADGSSWVHLSTGVAIHFPEHGSYLCQRNADGSLVRP